MNSTSLHKYLWSILDQIQVFSVVNITYLLTFKYERSAEM